MVCCFSGLISFAQSRSTQVEYQKINRPGVEIDLPFPVKTIENAIDESFSKMGYKSSKSKGFLIYRSVRLDKLGPDSYDLFFLVDKKSRRDKDNSVVSMLVSSGNDAFIDDISNHSVFGKSLSFLDSLRTTVAAYDLEQQILAQEDAVKSAEKKYQKLQDEGKDLESKKRKIESDISNNQKDQGSQVQELDKQRKILEALRARKLGGLN